MRIVNNCRRCCLRFVIIVPLSLSSSSSSSCRLEASTFEAEETFIVDVSATADDWCRRRQTSHSVTVFTKPVVNQITRPVRLHFFNKVWHIIQNWNNLSWFKNFPFRYLIVSCYPIVLCYWTYYSILEKIVRSYTRVILLCSMNKHDTILFNFGIIYTSR